MGFHIYEKAFTALCSCRLETSQTSSMYAEHSNRRCPSGVYTFVYSPQCILFNRENIVVFVYLIIYIAWGFFVARSNTSGNAKTSRRGTSDRNTLHAFFVYIGQVINKTLEC